MYVARVIMAVLALESTALGVKGVAEYGDDFGQAVAAGDFDGDGLADLVLGVPWETVNLANYAGAFNVLYGDPLGLVTDVGDQIWHEDSTGIKDVAENWDHLGWAFAVGDFNGDGVDDLAVGVPGENVSGLYDAGAVHIFFGTAGIGLTDVDDAVIHQDTAGVRGIAEESDYFGIALVAGDFDDDGFADLAVGVPNEDDGLLIDTGIVHVFYGSVTGPSVAGDELLSQNSGLLDTAEEGDLFGLSLAVGDFDGDGTDDLAIGAPYEDIGPNAEVDAGAIHVLYGDPAGLSTVGDQRWWQSNGNIDDISEAYDSFGEALATGDFNDDGFDDLAVGIENEDDGASIDSGAVAIIFGSATGTTDVGDQLWTQDSPGISFLSESDDFFGSALAAGDFDGDGTDDLAIGARGEDLGALSDAGAINVLPGLAGVGLTDVGNEGWSQASTGIEGVEEVDDWFGYALVAADFDGDGNADLAVGVPNESVGVVSFAGAVNVLSGSSLGGLTSTGDEIWD